MKAFISDEFNEETIFVYFESEIEFNRVFYDKENVTSELFEHNPNKGNGDLLGNVLVYYLNKPNHVEEIFRTYYDPIESPYRYIGLTDRARELLRFTEEGVAADEIDAKNRIEFYSPFSEHNPFARS